MQTSKKSLPSPWTTKLSPRQEVQHFCQWLQRPVTIGEVAIQLRLSLDAAEKLLDEMAQDGELTAQTIDQTPLYRCI